MPESVNEVYVDQVSLSLSPFSALLHMGAQIPSSTGGAQVDERVKVRMSLEHAKVMVMALKKAIRAFEDQQGFQIRIAGAVLNQMGLSEEDW